MYCKIAIFKLKVQNVAFWALAPSMYFNYAYSQEQDSRVSNLWRIHENRVKRGKEGTVKKTGNYTVQDHVGDRGLPFNIGVQYRMDQITEGVKPTQFFSNTFTRFNEQIEKYPDELFNADDHDFFTTDNFERMKHFAPKEGKTVGLTRVIPFQDTDEKYIHYDLQGESMYTNPPDPNKPAVDHKHDEQHIWNWQKTIMNQNVIKNTYSSDFQSIFKRSHAPWWGKKLIAPSWYNKESYTKFLKQWQIRREFEALKMRQASELRAGDLLQKDRHLAELS